MSAAHSRSLFGAHPSVRKSMNKQNQLDRQNRHERSQRLWRRCTHLHGPVAEQAIVVADQALPRHHRHVVVRQHPEPVHQPQAVQVGVRDAEDALVADGVAFGEPDLGACGAQRRRCERRSASEDCKKLRSPGASRRAMLVTFPARDNKMLMLVRLRHNHSWPGASIECRW